MPPKTTGFNIDQEIDKQIQIMKDKALARQPPHLIIVYPNSNPHGIGNFPAGAKRHTLYVALKPELGTQGTVKYEIRETNRFDFYVALCQMVHQMYL
jgi:hypothetical protein